VDQATGMTNGSHILARGDTHLPFALPRFGTPCAATLPPEARRNQSEYAATMMADMSTGDMGVAPTDPHARDDHDMPPGMSM
jgi:hypothetical protein